MLFHSHVFVSSKVLCIQIYSYTFVSIQSFTHRKVDIGFSSCNCSNGFSQLTVASKATFPNDDQKNYFSEGYTPEDGSSFSDCYHSPESIVRNELINRG